MNNPLDRMRTLEMASLSQLTYLACQENTEIVENILKSGCSPFIKSYLKVKFINAPRLFNSAHELTCCGILVSNSDDLVIAIRGTENLDDYFYDLLALPNSEGIHSGFAIYVEGFWEQVQDFLLAEDNGKKNIFITGHSLGGAAATLLAKRLEEPGFKPLEPYILETYSFGAPPVSATELFLDTPLYRFRNVGDWIPHLPKLITILINHIPGLKIVITSWKPEFLDILATYCHVEEEYLIEKNGEIRQLAQPQMGNVWQWMQFSRLLVPRLKTWDRKNPLRELISILIQTLLNEHRAIKYVERINKGKLPAWFDSRIDKNKETRALPIRTFNSV